MSEPHPSNCLEPSPEAAEPGTRRWMEIAVRVGVLVLLGSFVAALGAWEAWRVLSDIG